MRTHLKGLILLLTLVKAFTLPANAAGPSNDQKATAEREIRQTIEPVLAKYCGDDCKILSIRAEISSGNTNELFSPGFEEAPSEETLTVRRADVKILADDRLGKVRKARINELLNQLFESSDFPVDFVLKSTKFPAEADASQKVSEIREKVRRTFETMVQDVFQKFCPKNCLFSQFELDTEVVSLEEAQTGNPSDYYEFQGTAVRIDSIGGTLVFDRIIPENDQHSLSELVQLKAHAYSSLDLKTKIIDFPKIKGEEGEGWNSPFANSNAQFVNGKRVDQSSDMKSDSKYDSRSDSRSDSKFDSKYDSRNHSESELKSNSQSKSSENRDEKYSRYEKIERVENGDALHTEFQQLKVFGGIISAVILLLLGWMLFKGASGKSENQSELTLKTVLPNYSSTPPPRSPSYDDEPASRMIRASKVEPSLRFQVQNLKDHLITLFVENPRVTKHVFTKILLEEGIETTAAYISIFGETIVMEILRDPSLQSDINHLIEFYATTPIELTDEEQVDLLKKLQSRSVSGKLTVLSQNNKSFFDFLSDLDPAQIFALIREESMAVKGLIVTQTDPQKRSELLALFDAETRSKLMTELTRMEYLPKDYIRNVGSALRRKLTENAQLNTEPLASQEVLMNLLEESSIDEQSRFIRNLEETHPKNAKKILSQFVTIETLQYLPAGKMVEVLLSLKHDELLVLFKGLNPKLMSAIIQGLPSDLAADLQEELTTAQIPSREQANAIERKVINRLKTMANDKIINLNDLNEQLFSRVVVPLRKVG